MHTGNDIPHLLVVDDDVNFARLLERMLSNGGYLVTWAESGERALELLAETQFDLVLLDIRMPGIDGFETCRRIKCDPDTIAIPVIFMTAEGRSNEMLAQAINVGATDYLTKPLARVEVLSRVGSAIQQRVESLWLKQMEAEDKVTGLPGRNYFKSRIEEELSESSRFCTPVSVVLAELNGLEQVHANPELTSCDACDVWVIRFAALLRTESRRHDVVARLDGSRFGLLLPRVGQQGAAIATRRMSSIWKLTVSEEDETGNSVPAVFAVEAYDGTSTPPGAGDLLKHVAESLEQVRQSGISVLGTATTDALMFNDSPDVGSRLPTFPA